MRIFVTGGTGFIGRPAVQKLLADGHCLLLLSPETGKDRRLFEKSRKLEFVSGNLADVNRLKNSLKRFRPEVAVHLAWEGIPDYGARMSIKNLVYGLNLINILAELKCRRFVGVGSQWEYKQRVGKLAEDGLLEMASPFAIAKNSLHLLGRELAGEGIMQFVWLRLFSVYGPGQRPHSLIPTLIRSIKTGVAPQIKNPRGGMDFVYVEDVARAVAAVVKKCRKPWAVYNIGSGKLEPVRRAIELVYRAYRLKPPLDEKLKKVNGCWADISRIKREVSWRPSVTVEQGIRKTITAYRQNEMSGL